MDPDICLAALAPRRERELVSVGRQMAKFIECRRRPIRHHALLRRALPSRYARRQLKPGGAELGMIRDWGSGEVVDTMPDAFEDALGDQTSEGGLGDAGILRLAPREEAPLVLGIPREAAEGRITKHGCILAHH
ncbi:MAG TPA: hypothetical protein VIK08_12470 [Candidatus Limnocylindrales bacterium]